jgi:hypothetical protein
MSGDDGKNPPKPPRHLHSVDAPSPIKRFPPEQEKILFFKSNHVEWTPFAKSMGLNPRVEKPHEDFKNWAEEKRLIIAREQAEEVGESLFKHRASWHNDVLRTLKEYPEAADAVMAILKKRTNDIVQTINDDSKRRIEYANTGRLDDYVADFTKIKTSELTSLAVGMKVTTELKHKALMLDHWNIKEAELFTDPRQFETQKAEDQGWRLEILGQDGPMDALALRAMVAGYYDNKPVDGGEGQTIDIPLETT